MEQLGVGFSPRSLMATRFMKNALQIDRKKCVRERFVNHFLVTCSRTVRERFLVTVFVFVFVNMFTDVFISSGPKYAWAHAH